MKRTSLIPVSIYYALIYMSGGAFFSYVGLYYSHINLGNEEIGILTSISAVIALVAQPLWGTISDRAKYKNKVLMVCLLLSSVTIWLMPASGSLLWMLLLSTSLFYFFQCAVSPLSDAIALELASKGDFSFSKVRTVGSLGFAIMAGIAGKIFEKSISYIFIVFSVLIFASFLLSFFIPWVKGHQSGENKVNLIELFKDRKLIYIYVYVFILSSTLGFFQSFHAIYSQSLGISTELIGIGVMVGSLSQFPFMIFFDKIYKKFGIVNIILFSGLTYALRWLLFGTLLTPVTLIATWSLHGFNFIVLYLCLAEYVNSSVVKELKTSGQVMNSIILLGISKVFGGSVGGFLASAIGIGRSILICSAVSIIAVLAFFAVVKLSGEFKPDTNKHNAEQAA